MDVFVLKPAPVQACWLGLATTTGAPWVDYIFADPVVIPDLDHAQYYTGTSDVMLKFLGELMLKVCCVLPGLCFVRNIVECF